MIHPDTTPLAWASFRLARAFGWTPQEVQAMTMAQIAIYLDCLEQEAHGQIR